MTWQVGLAVIAAAAAIIAYGSLEAGANPLFNRSAVGPLAAVAGSAMFLALGLLVLRMVRNTAASDNSENFSSSSITWSTQWFSSTPVQREFFI